MKAYAADSQENGNRSTEGAASRKQAGQEEPTSQPLDDRADAVALRKQQEMANASSQVRQLMALREVMNNRLQEDPPRPAQRRLRRVEGKDHSHEDRERGNIRFQELQGGEYRVIDTDQTVRYDSEEDFYYTEDTDFEQTRVPIGNEAEEREAQGAETPTRYDIGAVGKGVANVAAETTLRTTGLISCIGWLLYNDTAAYLAHIVVLNPRSVIADGGIREQVAALADLFEARAGSSPTHVVIKADEGQPAYQSADVWKSAWMQELVPPSCQASWERGSGVLSHAVEPGAGERREWDGPEIEVRYPAVASVAAPTEAEEEHPYGSKSHGSIM